MARGRGFCAPPITGIAELRQRAEKAEAEASSGRALRLRAEEERDSAREDALSAQNLIVTSEVLRRAAEASKALLVGRVEELTSAVTMAAERLSIEGQGRDHVIAADRLRAKMALIASDLFGVLRQDERAPQPVHHHQGDRDA